MILKKKSIFTLLCFAIGAMFFVQCQEKKIEENTSPVKVIFDTDMGSDCDDVGALALLHAYADMGKAEIIGCIYSSAKVPYGAGVTEAINIYYGRDKIPVGANHGNIVGDPVDKMGAERLAKDTLAFKNTIVLNSDAEEQTRLNRKLLVDEADDTVVYITIGHTKGIYDLLASKPDDISPLSGIELVRKKLKHWVALGALRANNNEGHLTRDWNFFFNGTAPFTEYSVKNFPKPIYFVYGGSNTMTGKSLENTSPGNIVRRAYDDWLWNFEKKLLADQRPSWDLVTVYYAIEGLGPYFEEEPAGYLYFDTQEGCVWKEETNDYQHHYITQKPYVDDAFAEELNKLIALPPKN